MQSSKRFCPNCGTTLDGEQRFCPNCGSAVEATSGPTAYSGFGAPGTTGAAGYSAPTIASTPGTGPGYNAPTTAPTPGGGPLYAPPPPFGQDSMGSIAPPPPPDPYPSSYGQSSAQYPSTGQPVSGGYNVPDFARPQPRKGRTGLIVGSLLAVILLVVGAVIVIPRLGTSPHPQSTPTTSSQTQNTTTNDTNTPSAENTPTASNSSQPKQVTFSKPLTFTYASATITITSVQQATSFSDDSSYSNSNSGILRINDKEANNDTGTSFSSYYPTESLAIIEPDGTTAKAQNSQTTDSLDNGVNRQNWIDFSVPMSDNIGDLILQAGSSNEEQIKVPLKDGADLSQYQAKSFTPNKSTAFGSMNWTITNATISLSNGGNQAKKGQRYVSLTFKVVNNDTNNPAIASPYDYLRLKSGDTVTSVSDTGNVPVQFDAGSTTNCTAGFLVPLSSDGSYTLQLLGKSDDYWPATTATIDFQLK